MTMSQSTLAAPQPAATTRKLSLLDRYLTLERYDDFFIEGRPYLDRIVIQFVRDRSNMALQAAVMSHG